MCRKKQQRNRKAKTKQTLKSADCRTRHLPVSLKKQCSLKWQRSKDLYKRFSRIKAKYGSKNRKQNRELTYWIVYQGMCMLVDNRASNEIRNTDHYEETLAWLCLTLANLHCSSRTSMERGRKASNRGWKQKHCQCIKSYWNKNSLASR